jgi:Branched-chain amino acid transport system / permease component
MGIALELHFTGLGIGSIYALVALGFVLIYLATNVVDFAQGDFAMLGAFSMVVLCIDMQLQYWLGILITLAAMLVFGALFNFRSLLSVAKSRLSAGNHQHYRRLPSLGKRCHSPRTGRNRKPYQVPFLPRGSALARSFSILATCHHVPAGNRTRI